MPLTREAFHQELAELSQAWSSARRTRSPACCKTVLAAINRRDPARADETIAGDDRVDELHIQIEQAVETLLAREAPVASDLRLILAVLHINLHLERMGDQCVNIAKLAKLTFEDAPLPVDLMVTFSDMGEQAERMIAAAMGSFAARDLAQAEALVEMDQVINRANRDLVGRIMSLNGEASQEAGLRAILISRCLERIGDNAVDIGERTAYLVTTEFREFTDASHPDRRRFADCLIRSPCPIRGVTDEGQDALDRADRGSGNAGDCGLGVRLVVAFGAVSPDHRARDRAR